MSNSWSWTLPIWTNKLAKNFYNLQDDEIKTWILDNLGGSWYPVREMILQSLTWWKSGRFTHRVLRIYWFWQPTLQRRPHQHFGHTYSQALAPHRLKFKSQSRRFCWCHTMLGGCTISRVITHRMWSQAEISTSFSHQITFASSRCSFKICGLFHNIWQAS